MLKDTRIINSIDRSVIVAKSGGQFTTIQDAIDSITDNTTDRRYTVEIYPGTYTENIVLKDYVNIKGMGASSTDVKIFNVTGTILSFAGTSARARSIVDNVYLLCSPVSGTTNAKIINVDSGLLSIYRSTISGRPTETYMDGITCSDGNIYIDNTLFNYNQFGTTIGDNTHNFFNISGSGRLECFFNNIKHTWEDDSDNFNMITWSSSYITTDKKFFSNRFDIESDVDNYSGIFKCFNIISHISTISEVISSDVHISLNGLNPTGKGYLFYIDSSGNSSTVYSNNNHCVVTGFSKNYLAYIGVTDTLTSNFDGIVASDNINGSIGTYSYVNSPSDGNLQISGSYLNMYAQALTVGARGADHTIIQEAIDAITDAAVDKRYVILIYPGTYTENVDLTGKPYIDLKAISTRSATIITSSTGTTLTLSDTTTIVNDIKIRTTGGKILEIPVVATTVKYKFAGGSFQAIINDSTAIDAIEIKGGSVQFTRSFIHYIQTGTGGGTHRLVNITGAALFTLLITDMTMDVTDPDDDVVGIEEANEVITTTFTASKFLIERTGIVTGETIGYYANGTSADKLLSGCYLELLNNGSGGNASAIKTAGNGCVVTKQANTVKVLNFTNNWSGNVAATDIIYSNFDTITAAQHDTGAGTYNAIHASSDGDFHVHRDIILNRNMEIEGTLALASGTTVNEITTTVSSPGSDDLLVTEKSLVNWTDGLAALYIKLDGSTPFTGTVVGVIPTANAHLATKGYVDGIAAGGGTNDLGPFVTTSLCEPTGSETVGDKYIVCSDSTGVWTGYEDDVATAVDSTGAVDWTFETPVAGKHGWVTDKAIDYTFNGTDWVSTGTLIDHTTIQNIGTNTHVQIDAHIANVTSNPHSVDNTDVGLSDVTNDAQLKRSANDWVAASSILEKTVTVDLDRFLIEDSEDGQKKKFVLMSNIVDQNVKVSATDTVQDYLINKVSSSGTIAITQLGGGGDETLQIGNIYGSEFQETSDDTETTNTTTAFVQKLRMTTTDLPTGIYRIGFYCEFWQSSAVDQAEVQVELNDTTLIAEASNEPKDLSDRFVFQGFMYQTISSVNTIDIDYRQQGGNTAYIRRARIELWRVS